MKIDQANAKRLARLLGGLGVVALVICLLLTAFESYLPSWFSEKTKGAPAQQSSFLPADCNAQLKEALDPSSKANVKAAASDSAGNLRIVEVWPPTIRLAGQLCVVVAGVAPQAGEDRLKRSVEEKTAGATTAQKQSDRAIEEANAATALAAESEAKAAAAQRDQAANAKELKEKADKDRAEATAKETSQTEQQKKLTAANDALSEALAAANRGLPAIEIALFLNERRSPLTIKAHAVSRPQLLIYEFGQTADAASEDAKFWRGLLAGKTQGGLMSLRIGLSRSQSSGPEQVYATPIEFRVFWPVIIILGAVSMVLLFAAFAIFAATSTVLRDNPLANIQFAEAQANAAQAAAVAKNPRDPDLDAAANAAQKAFQDLKGNAKANDAAGTFSLGRTQMALWLGLSTAGFIFIWLTLGFYRNVITEAILVLLGINSVTGLAAILLDKDDPAKPAPKTKSVGFLKDITCDSEGAKLQRIQVVIWTCILAVIFTWNVVANFVFVEFDTYLLLLMGIVSSTYLGFKTQEKVQS